MPNCVKPALTGLSSTCLIHSEAHLAITTYIVIDHLIRRLSDDVPSLVTKIIVLPQKRFFGGLL